MSWKQISECLPAELTAMMKMEKAGAAKAPASVTGQHHVEGDDISDTASSGVEERPALPDMDRGMLVAAKAGRPTQATSIPMFMVIEGGRQTVKGGTRSADRTRAREEIRGEPAREFLRLVVG